MGQTNQSGLHLNQQAQHNLNALTNFTLSNENLGFNLAIAQFVAGGLTLALPVFFGIVGSYFAVVDGNAAYAPLYFLLGAAFAAPVSLIAGVVWWRVNLAKRSLRKS